MFFVVTYDVSDDDRRSQIADLLGRYGQRVQLSVFECHLDDESFAAVLAATAAILENPDQGSVRFYRWCAACRDASTGLGGIEPETSGPLIV